jgi:hypothetical protein
VGFGVARETEDIDCQFRKTTSPLERSEDIPRERIFGLLRSKAMRLMFLGVPDNVLPEQQRINNDVSRCVAIGKRPAFVATDAVPWADGTLIPLRRFKVFRAAAYEAANALRRASLENEFRFEIADAIWQWFVQAGIVTFV